MPLKKTGRHGPIQFLLEPGQTLAEYNALKRKWDKKLSTTGHRDIEHMDSRGNVSIYFTDYPLERLKQSYSPEQAEYYRQTNIFYLEFDWQSLRFTISPPMARFIWLHWSNGYHIRHIAKLLQQDPKCPVRSLWKGRVPRKRTVKGPVKEPPSLFWVHTVLHDVLFKAFNKWVKSAKGRKALQVDWSLD